jgi:hypothetical protein
MRARSTSCEIGLLTKTESGPHECEFGQQTTGAPRKYGHVAQENRNESGIPEREEEFLLWTRLKRPHKALANAKREREERLESCSQGWWRQRNGTESKKRKN